VEENPYSENHRTDNAKFADGELLLIEDYLRNPFEVKSLSGLNKKDRMNFINKAKRFAIQNDRLYKLATDEGNIHQLVVPKEKRMWMMMAAHDHLGHKGLFATEDLLSKRFWWPDMNGDINWFIRSCKECQERDMRLQKMPPTLTYTPSLFQKIHIDVFKLSPASNGYNMVIHGRCALTSWSEARAIKKETARIMGEWFFDEILCRWGCPEEVVSDNAPAMKNVLSWLEEKYGIRGVRISPYNSQGNGKIERAHLDIREALSKATSGHLGKWYWFLKPILWADRITVRRGLGCSPYFAVTGAEPILPLDIVESTWLVKTPDRTLSTSELIGLRAQALAKHQSHVEAMRNRVDENKRKALRAFEKHHRGKIRNFNFAPGTLVQIRNSAIETNLDRKMYPRYLGPMVVIRRTKGGSYVIAQMDGTLLKEKVAAFRVLPHVARYRPIKLPQNIHDLIDVSKEKLDEMILDDDEQEPGIDYAFASLPNFDTSEGDFEHLRDNEVPDFDEVSDLDEDSDLDREGVPTQLRKSKRLAQT
jgi:hypothetical protein